MARSARPLAFVVLATAALLAAGCGKSNNEGKIVGKWKILEAPGFDANMVQQLEQQKLYAFMEFTAGGVVTIGATSTDPFMREMLAKSPEPTVISCKYKLLSGDGIEMYDLPKELKEKGGMFGKDKDRARTKIKIDGDNMTMTDDDGKTGRLVRIKEEAAPTPKQ